MNRKLCHLFLKLDRNSDAEKQMRVCRYASGILNDEINGDKTLSLIHKWGKCNGTQRNLLRAISYTNIKDLSFFESIKNV